ncbi:MAG: ROK family protein [Caldilineaceae bacterium]|nr:ROK family protein [Caldilineaceae bacterium]
MAPIYLSLDIGGTKIAAAAVDAHLQMRGRITVPTRSATPAALLASIRQAVAEVVSQAGAEPGAIQAVGCGVPGQVDAATGLVRHAVNLNLSHYPLGARLREELGRPVAVENDVRLASLGAYHHLRRTRPNDRLHLNSLLYISIGTGLAAGLVINGQLYRGRHGLAGEIGHVPVDPDGPRCACGARGCAEEYISGRGLLRLAREHLSRFPGHPLLTRGDELTTRAIFQAAAAGDEAGSAIIDAFAARMARLLYAVAMSYDPDFIVLGGGIINAGPVLFQALQRHMEEMRTEAPVARMLLPPERIIALAGENMGIQGGIMLAVDAGCCRT